MRALALAIAMTVASVSGAALAEPLVTVQLPAQPTTASAFRLRTVTVPVDRSFRLNAPDSVLHTGYAGMFDLFPFEGGAFRISGGPRLFSSTGRWRSVQPESLQYLQPFRYGSLRASRKFRPALLVGYGRTVDQGVSLGVDAGIVNGKIGTTPDRLGRLNRERLDALGGRAMRQGLNELVRMTALYRF